MAGEWIKMRSDLHDDPAVFRLASLLQIDIYSVIGRLQAFWSWADRHSVDGVVDGVVEANVDDVVRLGGFAVALAQVAWLEVSAEGIRIPKFDRHNGESAKKRALKNERQARWRAGKDEEVGEHVDATPSTKASTREEKRREEKKQTPASAGFDSFWKAWPATDRKTAKAKCAEKWAKGGFESMAAGIVAHVETMKATNKNWIGGYEPAPLKYLNEQRWKDSEGGPDSWWLAAGFETQWDALNGGCTEHNAKFFKDGHREGVPA